MTTGDESFDALMRVDTGEPDRVLLVLDSDMRRQILDLAFDGKLWITARSVSFSAKVQDPSASSIVATVRRLVAVAKALETTSPTSGSSA